MSARLALDPTRLRHARLERALTQNELADLADVHVVTVSRLEGGVQAATPSTIRRLANALGVEVLTIATIAEAVAV